MVVCFSLLILLTIKIPLNGFFITAPKESMMAEEIKFTVFYNECYCSFSLILLFLCHFVSLSMASAAYLAVGFLSGSGLAFFAHFNSFGFLVWVSV